MNKGRQQSQSCSGKHEEAWSLGVSWWISASCRSIDFSTNQKKGWLLFLSQKIIEVLCKWCTASECCFKSVLPPPSSDIRLVKVWLDFRLAFMILRRRETPKPSWSHVTKCGALCSEPKGSASLWRSSGMQPTWAFPHACRILDRWFLKSLYFVLLVQNIRCALWPLFEMSPNALIIKLVTSWRC